MTRCRWWYVSLIIFGFCGMGVAAERTMVLADFSTAQEVLENGWQLAVKKGKADLQLVQDDSGQALQLRSDRTSFALQKEVSVALEDLPYLVWQWKVTVLPRGGDFRRAQVDDQAAQLIVAFSARHFLSYIWDSTAPQGTFDKAPSLPFRSIFALVLQSGAPALGSWIMERRNLLDDYEQVFGGKPTMLQGLRIQINSQHTGSQAESYWKSILLTNQHVNY